MADLVIKGHPTRGKEVIEILEMLGGVNKYQIGAFRQTCVYFIDINGIIRLLQINQLLPEKDVVYSLEEFLEKFPYKVGDKVTLDNKLCSIIWMCWECNNIYYQVQGIGDVFTKKVTADELNLYKEETMEKEEENFAECIEKTIQECLFGKKQDTKEIKIDIPEGYEFFGVDDNKVVLTKIQSQYPKTYEECCQVLMGKTDFQDFELVLTRYVINRSEENSISLCPPHISLINNFYKILICRDAYWKIAGEELGLDKPWEFENPSKNWVFTIEYAAGCIYKHAGMNILYNHILVFPTEEMRDAFYENFKDLIDSCTELL